MNNYEILAPVGAQEQLKAAVRCGANAVYLGTSNFNARRNANNFNNDSLKEVVDYCHARLVKVYITLNTLVFDKETEELCATVKAIAESGADAVIVQDFAVFKTVKNICPDLPVHASTQMAVHNVSGAKLLENEGFARIVLARELSFEEIKKIRKNVKAELEVFVHGAHCMSTSGNCYLSAMLGERSGNRGLCAQGCRLNWHNVSGREYALSLKDMSYLDNINDLKDIGIESFKIEGRMKRPEYVAAAVSSLKNALNGNTYDKETLRNIFSRNGFTDGYLKGKRDVSMFGYRGKEDVTSATKVLKELETLYKDDIHPVTADFYLEIKKDEPSVLTVTASGKSVSVTGDVAQEPIKAPLSYEIASRSIAKLGDTPFSMGSFTFSNPYDLTLSASSINAMRRAATEKAVNEIVLRSVTTFNYNGHDFVPYSPREQIKTRIRLNSFSQYSPLFNDVEYIILPLDEILENAEKISPIKSKIIAELPQLIYPLNEEKICEKLVKLNALGINYGFTGNIGGIALLKKFKFRIFGSHGLNVTNTHSLEYYENLGLEDITLSFELTENAIKNMGGNTKRGIYIYGYIPLMLMRTCPQKAENGCNNCNGTSFLTDRKNINFPLLCHNKEYCVLHNSIPLYIGDKNLSSIDFATLYFTKETQEECIEIYNKFKNRKTINGAKTNGLFARELL